MLHPDIDRKNSRGAAVIEIALAMPILLLSLFGTVEFGRAFVLRENLVSAAAEAARVASQSSCPRPTEAEVLAAVYTTLEGMGLDPSLATITLTNPGGTSGTDVTLEVAYDAQFPVLSKLLNLDWAPGGTLTVSAAVSAENE